MQQQKFTRENKSRLIRTSVYGVNMQSECLVRYDHDGLHYSDLGHEGADVFVYFLLAATVYAQDIHSVIQPLLELVRPVFHQT